ncbi:MAG: hypothetical protein QHH74_16715 [Spirochaetota bacterium]|nr:hypothetical protein [Spirochaetota bacterium]
MKIDQQLKDIEGKPLISGDKGKVLTMRDICINSLLTPIQGDDEKAKWEKYEIFKKLRDANSEVELKLEELNIIKKAVGKIQPPLLMGEVFDMLEGK